MRAKILAHHSVAAGMQQYGEIILASSAINRTAEQQAEKMAVLLTKI
jgi:hypothetical protein